MVHAIRIHSTGGPEQMVWEEVSVPAPGPNEALIRQTAIGVNYIDVYFRDGSYPLPQMPGVIGMEGAGVIEAVGSNVTTCKPGDRVAYAMGPVGAYTEARVMPADRLVTLPPEIDDKIAASIMLQGMTTNYLVTRTYKVKKGDTILVHAAAGGVGLMMCQWASHIGATVIGTVSTAEKAALAKAHGCTHIVYYTKENVAERVRELTGGAGVPVVYDSVGKDTFDASINSLQTLGMMVLFGASSGKPPAIEAGTLQSKGSLYFTRPSLAHYAAKREDLLSLANGVFDMVKSGALKVSINQTFALKDAAEAHRALEGRKTTGSTVLLP